ncbi:membrane lipoprotein lipid attachment site-containing protein [Hymenobacter sediminicola]|uniref:Membrane lipoprotein lipid attachment site-containing protein n=1 Tax=Hymenobacter sediminicola TaxID=2761579 RepID=A0A7G7W6D7_9BACT|nr:membrane lipoprotein lipid attachment site-containing protein [Hymenobacter sediminicola]QNH61930.1 membrane lipoprotein lipid attachment site-containing protein [Hymenobacter sediminicola]
MKRTFLVALAGLAMLSGCQQTPSAESTQTPSAQQAQEQTSATGAPTATAARAAVGQYLQGQPNAALYVLDSASVVEVDDRWQVLVPRTDWAGRMPNRAAFEVDKSTGTVSTLAVK